MEPFEKLHFFNWEQGGYLVKLLLAHLLSEFVFRKHPDCGKTSLQGEVLHILAVYLSAALLTGWWWAAAVITAGHAAIDQAKAWLRRNNKGSRLSRLVADQGLHLSLLIVVWIWVLEAWQPFRQTFMALWNSYHACLLLLGYVFVTNPAGRIIGLATSGLGLQDAAPAGDGTDGRRGGRYIGIYERIIILTLVLLNQYEAIGFLVAAKGIIRFAGRDEDIRSEYVLVGTMMSYAFAILTGVLLNWLLHIK